MIAGSGLLDPKPLNLILQSDTVCLFLGPFWSKSVSKAKNQKWGKGPSVLISPLVSIWRKAPISALQACALNHSAISPAKASQLCGTA